MKMSSQSGLSIVAWAAALSAAACSAGKVDLGNTAPASSAPATTTDAAPGAAAATLDAPLCTSPATLDGVAPDLTVTGDLTPLLGAWTGYVEAYSFPQSGSSALALTLAIQANGTVGGTITFGDELAVPAPQSADEAYPPGAKVTSGDAILSLGPWEGFPYLTLQPSLDGTRLRFGVESLELWSGWCGLQTPYAGSNGVGCGCLPNWNGHSNLPNTCQLQDPQTGQWVGVGCAQVALCVPSVVCACAADGCTIDMTHPDVAFDMQSTTGHLDGSIGFNNTTLNVHFTKLP